jgi:hypothetical protein
MKKLRIAVLAVGLLVCSSLPAKKAEAQGARWYVYLYSLTHWLCVNGGVNCCPGFGC